MGRPQGLHGGYFEKLQIHVIIFLKLRLLQLNLRTFRVWVG